MLTSAKDFSGQNLRGRSFKGQDLFSAKFIGADIRGADFRYADLRGADFTRARAGLKIKMAIVLLLTSLVLASLSTVFQGVFVVGYFDLLFKTYNNTSVSSGSVGILTLTIMFMYGVIYRKGMEAALRAVLLVFGVAVAVGVALTVISDGGGVIYVALTGIFAVAVSIVVASAFIVAGAGAAAVVVAGIIAVIGAVVSTDFVAGVVGGFFSAPYAIDGLIAFATVIIITLLNTYLAWRVLKGDEKQAIILRFAVALTGWGGTSFRGANLSEANLSEALLKNCDFREAILIRTCWQSAKKLLLARTRGTILADSRVRILLETGNYVEQSFVGKNLKGGYLAGYDLSGVDFTEADLSEADLRGAKLTNANLMKVHAIGTLFQGADLTGACIEDWNIDHTTQLEGVICRYVYMLNGQRERQPSHGEFQEGQFNALFEKVFDTVNLIFDQKGIDWQAFTQVFGQMQVAYGEHGTELAVQAIERKSDGTFIVKVKVPPETDKATIQQEFFREYENKLALLETKYQAQLQAKNEIIAVYREQNTRMDIIVHTLAQTALSAKLAQKPIKILFLAANPKDTDRLRLDEEIREIDHALRQAKFRDEFDIEQHWAVRVAELQGLLLRHEPDVVHFSGHGSSKGEIVLEDGAVGESQTTSLRALSRLFELLNDNIRCVILNACYTKPQAEEIAKHVPCVIGMSKAIGDAAAIQFASAFYQALGYGKNIRTAFALGCGQIDLVGLNEQDTPQLLVQNKMSEEMVLVKESQSNTESI